MIETLTLKKEGFGILAKLMSGLVLILLANGIVGFYYYTQMNRLSDLTTKIYNHPLRVTRAVLSADTNIVKIHRSMKDVALSSTKVDLIAANDAVNVYEKEVYKHLNIVEKWILGDEGSTLLAETAYLFSNWKPIRDEVIILTKAGNRAEAIAITKEKGARHVELLNNKIEELKNYAATKASGMLRDSLITRTKVLRTTTIILLTISVFAGLFGYFFSRTITDSIKKLIKGIEEFGLGNLNYKIEVKSKDEINWLANAFNNMAHIRKKTEEEIFNHREHLEKLVKGRTTELEKEITKREQAEQEILKSKILLESSIESPKDMIILSLDREYRYLYFNKTHAQSMVHVFGAQPQIGDCIFDYMQGKDDIEKVKGHYDQSMAGEGHIAIEEYGEDQFRFYYEIRYNPIYNEKNEIIGTTSFAQNITDRKQAEEKIKANLNEKETLLQEIHHRVKNNMQVISSLLKLQAGSVEDKKVKEALNESQSRVYAMSALHEALYGSENLAEIDFKAYLSTISNALIRTYQLNHGKVKFNIESDNILLNMKMASPLGLTINELITNSLIHAFPGDKNGEINIKLKNQADNDIELSFMDDGIGIPDGLDWKKPRTLGLRLIRDLVEKQLNGSINLAQSNGTRFTINFNTNKA
jgi:two-component sensor histidine kinase/HAMP domain-containing protein